MILMLEIVIWFFVLILFYTYLGYGILLGLLVKLKTTTVEHSSSYLPTITHIIPAYNEQDILREKLLNSLQLDYPRDKYTIMVVTDGSDDNSPAIVDSFEDIIHLHSPSRGGKVGAINRAVRLVTTEIVVISDANTKLNQAALRHLVHPFNEEDIGVVAGEKRVLAGDVDSAPGSGEGLYWRYESLLKKWDGQLYSVIGAAGELFAVRKKLLFTLKENIILEDFYISLALAMKGYRTAYAPDAIATENASVSIHDELKRKIRIAAGGFQAMWLLRGLLNVFKYGILSFQYISHRLLRWTLAPAGLIFIFIGTAILAFKGMGEYQFFLTLQILFYGLASLGAIFHDKNVKLKVFFVPFYFTFMNYAVIRGFWRFIRGKQSAVWDKSRRKAND
jgi:poly-beta-1,6-N-acetyl-D-glucosamine synthase